MVEEFTSSEEHAQLDEGENSLDFDSDEVVGIDNHENEEAPEVISNLALGRNELALLAKHFDAQELDVVIRQINTDDEVFKMGSKLDTMIKFRVDLQFTMFPIHVEVPVYESVKYLKRRIFKENLRNNLFTKIDKYELLWQKTEQEEVLLQDNDPNTFEKYLNDFGFELDKEYNLKLKIVSRESKDKEIQDSLIRESKAKAASGAFSHLTFSDDLSIKKLQRLFQGENVDDVQYKVLRPLDGTPASGEKRGRDETASPSPSPNVRRRGAKWTVERTNAFIESLLVHASEPNPWKAILDDSKIPGTEAYNMFPTESKERGTFTFKSGDLKDKWANIVRNFNRDTGEPDIGKLEKARTLKLDEEHLRNVKHIILSGRK